MTLQPDEARSGLCRDDAPGHKGYVLGCRRGAPDADGEKVFFVQVACECGWRSPFMVCPPGTCYFPLVDLPKDYEDAAGAIWGHHVDSLLGGAPGLDAWPRDRLGRQAHVHSLVRRDD